MLDKKQYRLLELGRLCSQGGKIKIKTDTAETKWLNLTDLELEKIKAVLCK